MNCCVFYMIQPLGLVCHTLGDEPHQFHAQISFLGLEYPSVRGLKIIAAVFYAYHAVKFRAQELRISEPSHEQDRHGSGASLPHTYTRVSTDAAHTAFVEAFKAAAMVAGIVAPARSSSESDPSQISAVATEPQFISSLPLSGEIPAVINHGGRVSGSNPEV